MQADALLHAPATCASAPVPWPCASAHHQAPPQHVYKIRHLCCCQQAQRHRDSAFHDIVAGGSVGGGVASTLRVLVGVLLPLPKRRMRDLALPALFLRICTPRFSRLYTEARSSGLRSSMRCHCAALVSSILSGCVASRQISSRSCTRAEELRFSPKLVHVFGCPCRQVQCGWPAGGSGAQLHMLEEAEILPHACECNWVVLSTGLIMSVRC